MNSLARRQQAALLVEAVDSRVLLVDELYDTNRSLNTRIGELEVSCINSSGLEQRVAGLNSNLEKTETKARVAEDQLRKSQQLAANLSRAVEEEKERIAMLPLLSENSPTSWRRRASKSHTATYSTSKQKRWRGRALST